MPVTPIFMTIIAGMSVALSAYFLVSALFSKPVGINNRTVKKAGIIGSSIIFALCGPVMVLKLWFGGPREEAELDGVAPLFIIMSLSLLWCGVLGFVVTRGAFIHIASG